MENALSLWQDTSQLAELKKTYGANLTDMEWSTFLQIGKATNLNPFLREIYCVKYGNAPASIFIGRDGYRKSAQSHPQYDYHISDAVYSADKFFVEGGIPNHSYDFSKTRGQLVGAYCLVKRKSSSQPNFVFVELKEYNTGKSIWATKPATMIKKVAEAQALRMTFQELFAGTYDESEEWEDKKAQTKVKVVEKPLPQPETIIKKITEIQHERIMELWGTYVELDAKIPLDQREAYKMKILQGYYKVKSTLNLSFFQAEDLIGRLDKKITALLEEQKNGSKQNALGPLPVLEPEPDKHWVKPNPVAVMPEKKTTFSVYSDFERTKGMITKLTHVDEVSGLQKEIQTAFDQGDMTASVFEQLTTLCRAQMEKLHGIL